MNLHQRVASNTALHDFDKENYFSVFAEFTGDAGPQPPTPGKGLSRRKPERQGRIGKRMH